MNRWRMTKPEATRWIRNRYVVAEFSPTLGGVLEQHASHLEYTAILQALTGSAECRAPNVPEGGRK